MSFEKQEYAWRGTPLTVRLWFSQRSLSENERSVPKPKRNLRFIFALEENRHCAKKGRQIERGIYSVFRKG
jgi:hypothetical protein